MVDQDTSVDSKTRILIVDDHPFMRQGLRHILQSDADFDVVAEAENGMQAVERAREVTPDVILMDISMPEMNGIEATRIIHDENPGISIIGLSMFEAADKAAEMKAVGASHYVSKSGPVDQLLEIIRSQPRLSDPQQS